MGYYTSLQLVNVKIKDESIPLVNRILNTGKGRGLSKIRYFFEIVVIDDEGFLRLKDKENLISPYGVNDKDGTSIALDGKWYESDKFASWLKTHCEKGGKVVEHSSEGDGEAWGWEFDGKGRMKYFQLDHVGKWK